MQIIERIQPVFQLSLIHIFIVSKADTAEQVQSAGTFLTAVETYLRTKY